MRGRVLQQLYLVEGARDDLAAADNDRADRDFFFGIRFLRQTQCFAHEVGVARQIDECVHSPNDRSLAVEIRPCGPKKANQLLS